MRYNTELQEMTYCMPISNEDFLALTKFEGVGVQQLFIDDCTELYKYLEKIKCVSQVDYNGHYGAAIHFKLDASEDAIDQKIMLQCVDQVVANFVDDARRVMTFFADRDHGNRSYELLYTDDDFVILATDNEDEIYIGHDAGYVLLSGKKKFSNIINKIRLDINERSIFEDEGGYLPKTPSRSIEEVKKWVSKHVKLPDENHLPTVSLGNNPLIKAIPNGGRPVFADDGVVFCDCQNRGFSVTVTYDDTTGTAYFTDGAKDQIVEKIKVAKSGAAARQKFVAKTLENYGSNYVPSDFRM